MREELLAPLLRQLGYRSGTPHAIIRELTLRYPYSSLGHPKPTDPVLRGRADYVLDIEGRVRWVLEAKPPQAPISVADVAQAWSYANHPEVRAVYFGVCNGHDLLVYRTSAGPDAPPLVTWTTEQLVMAVDVIANVLGPTALLRDYATLVPDLGLPLASGLRSVARVSNGKFRLHQTSVDMPVLYQLEYSITQGTLERAEAGGMVLYVETRSPIRDLQVVSAQVGLTNIELFSESMALSIDAAVPTVFVYAQSVVFPAGTSLLNVQTWTPFVLEQNLTAQVQGTAAGVWQEGVFRGTLRLVIAYVELELVVEVVGTFTLNLI